eukprot:186683_1
MSSKKRKTRGFFGQTSYQDLPAQSQSKKQCRRIEPEITEIEPIESTMQIPRPILMNEAAINQSNTERKESTRILQSTDKHWKLILNRKKGPT